MNPDTGGQSRIERQKETAQRIARERVMAAYAAKNPNTVSTDTSAKMKDAPIATRQTTPTDWQKYHSAWQNYYQKYYSNYYSNAAKDYVAREKMKLESEKVVIEASKKAGDSKGAPIENNRGISDEEVIGRRLKESFKKRAFLQGEKRRRRRHLVPIIASVVLILVVLFLQYNRLIFAPIMAYVSPGESASTEISAVDPTVAVTVSPDPKLIIPKLNVEVPVAFDIPLSEVDHSMMTGVAHFKIAGASALPGEIGNLVISGHSAGDIYSNIQYKFIFSGLERLENNDLIYINYNSKRYTYSVFEKRVVEPTEISALTETRTEPTLILLTCTPLGTSRYRLLVYAKQISPVDEGATVADKAGDAEPNASEALPANQPTFFENVWNWLTGN
ncbi:sortase [Candidatus Saccharibacteria bacterium]|nr:sortase [Candidatus Saccharibacteria bacterium]